MKYKFMLFTITIKQIFVNRCAGMEDRLRLGRRDLIIVQVQVLLSVVQ